VLLVFGVELAFAVAEFGAQAVHGVAVPRQAFQHVGRKTHWGNS
jgi:hypothetical protein